MQRDDGKPRPALVIQSDQLDAHATVTVLLVSSTLINAPLFRVTVQPTEKNGLQKTSQVMVDKAMTVRRDKLGETIGVASDELLYEIGRCLAVFLGIVR